MTYRDKVLWPQRENRRRKKAESGVRPRRTPSHDPLLAVVSFHSWFPKATLLVRQYVKIHTLQLVDVQSLFLVLCSARIPPDRPPPENLIQRPNHWWQVVGPISTLPHFESLASYWRQAGKAILCVAERWYGVTGGIVGWWRVPGLCCPATWVPHPVLTPLWKGRVGIGSCV